MYFVDANFDLSSALVTEVVHAISCYIGPRPRYNRTRLYITGHQNSSPAAMDRGQYTVLAYNALILMTLSYQHDADWFLRKSTRDIIANIFLYKVYFVSARLHCISARSDCISVRSILFPRDLYHFRMGILFPQVFFLFPQCYIDNLAQIKETWWKWYYFAKIQCNLTDIHFDLAEIQFHLAEIQFHLAEMN